MANAIILMTIPGIGTQEKGYSNGMVDDIKKFSKKTALEGNIRFIETRPFGVTHVDNNQEELFNRLDKANKMGGILSLRKFVLEAFGDGVTFERGAHLPDSTYRKIHTYLKGEIEEANSIIQGYEKAKLVIVGSSLGVHILSTYIWDADNGKNIFENEPANNANNLSNLSFLASIGCNLPLFVSGMEESQIKPFDGSKRAADFTWDNYYDKDDVLGWPLKQMSPEYDKLVTDYQINTGLYIGSHVRYWKDNDFTKPFTRKLVEMFEGI